MIYDLYVFFMYLNESHHGNEKGKENGSRTKSTIRPYRSNNRIGEGRWLQDYDEIDSRPK